MRQIDGDLKDMRIIGAEKAGQLWQRFKTDGDDCL